MYSLILATGILRLLPSRNDVILPAANNPYPCVLLHASIFQAVFGLTTSAPSQSEAPVLWIDIATLLPRFMTDVGASWRK